jgi:xanthine dehydrogenase accessory factor
MANHLQRILAQWYPVRDQQSWVLATVIAVEGSHYRKAGAMMLVNEAGQYFGLISGGCLEKSLLVEVKKTLAYGRPLRLYYDSSETGDLPWARALGCGGKVTILLQPVSAANQYQTLDAVYAALQARKPVRYGIAISSDSHSPYPNNRLLNKSGSESDGLLQIALHPVVHLMVFGGGVDAIPLVQMASVLGWQVTLVDNRVGYAEPAQFAPAEVMHTAADSPEVQARLHCIDAAILMTHNIAMDALALRQVETSSAHYIGLLGSSQRKHKVLEQAHIGASNPQYGGFSAGIYSPMGFDIGGDLPESIALSVLAECHQVLEARHNPSLKASSRRFAP